jgi:hypothetical protein
MVLIDFGSFWSFPYDFGRFPLVFARFRPVRENGRTGERATQPPQTTSQLLTWTQGQILDFTIPGLIFADSCSVFSSRGRCARSWAQLWPNTCQKPPKN